MTAKEAAAKRAAEIKQQIEEQRRQQIAEQLRKNKQIRAQSMGRATS